jgi:hypothetical protein
VGKIIMPVLNQTIFARLLPWKLPDRGPGAHREAANPEQVDLQTAQAGSFTAAMALPLWVTTLCTLGFVGIVIWRPLSQYFWLHNAITLALLAATCLSLASAAFLVKTDRDWGLLAVHAVVIGFLVRGIPVLMLAYPPVHDGYFYFVSFLNIFEAHSLNGVYQGWYGDVGRQLHWPVLQLLTAQISYWSGIAPADLWRFLPPAIGSLTFIAVSLMAYSVFEDWRIASIAGLLGSFSDLVISYQSEYQPQGVAIVVFTFLTYMVLTSRASTKVGARTLTLCVGAAFLFTHHASSLVLPGLLSPALLMPSIGRTWNKLTAQLSSSHRLPIRMSKNVAAEIELIGQFGTVVAVLVVAALTMHIYLSIDILQVTLHSISNPLILTATSGPAEWTNPSLWWLNTLRQIKYILLILGAIGVALTLRRPSTTKIALIMLMGGLSVASFLGIYVLPAGTTRFLALWYSFIAIFAAVALASLGRAAGAWRSARSGIAILVIGGYMAGSITNAQIPAYLLDGLPRSTWVWYGNEMPRTDRMEQAGHWLDIHTPANARYGVDFATRMAPFFFAHRSADASVFNAKTFGQYCTVDYLIVDHTLDQDGFMQPRINIDYGIYPRIYDNGSIAVFQRLPGSPCYKSTVEPQKGTPTSSPAQ